MMDNVVTSFNEEDVNRLGDNIVLILNTVKDMTQPEIMNFVRSHPEASSRGRKTGQYFSGRCRQMQDPAVRRGLALTMRCCERGRSASRRRWQNELSIQRIPGIDPTIWRK